MNVNRISIFNTYVDNFTMTETISLIDDCISKRLHIHHGVINAGKIVLMQEDKSLQESVNSCDIINADGQAVVWASKILNKPLKERVAGIDIMHNLVELAHQKKYKIFFLGATDEVLKIVIEKYKNQYSENIIAGYRNGYFSKDEETQVAKEIANSGANILFVAISSPKKENFLYDNKEILSKVNFIMGVGGSFDVEAGKVKRAPLWMQKIGLEWFFRFLQEPKRMWKRSFVTNAKFITLTFKEKFNLF